MAIRNRTVLLLGAGVILIAIGAFVLKGSTGSARKEQMDTVLLPTSTPQSTRISPTAGDSVPLPLPEDILRAFVQLINDDRIPDAISYMAPELVGDEAGKQAWGVQFNAIKSIRIVHMDPPDSRQMSGDRRTFKVTFNVSMDPASKTAPIPYYGWNDGENIRWITLSKTGKLWKIASIATGP